MDERIEFYIARDEDGTLNMFVEKPVKTFSEDEDRPNGAWGNDLMGESYCQLNSEWFPEIKWEDERPTKFVQYLRKEKA